MRTPYTQLYVHLVWATWDRLPLLSPEVRAVAYACIQAQCVDLKVETIAIGGMEDHVHLLVRIPTTISVAQFAKQVKGASAHLIVKRFAGSAPFKWQGGYGAFTVSKSLVPQVREYILNQEQHHQDGSVYPAVEPPGDESI